MDNDEVECIVFGWTRIGEHDLRSAIERAARATGVTFTRLDYDPVLATIGIEHDDKQAWFELESTDVGSDLSMDPTSEDPDDEHWREFFEVLASELGGEIDFDEIERRNSLDGGVGVIRYVPLQTRP